MSDQQYEGAILRASEETSWQGVYGVLHPGAHVFLIGDTVEWDVCSFRARLAGFHLRDTISVMHPGGWFPLLLFRKPLEESTLVKQVLKTKTGAINIDASRVFTDWNEADRPDSWKRSGYSAKTHSGEDELVCKNCHVVSSGIHKECPECGNDGAGEDPIIQYRKGKPAVWKLNGTVQEDPKEEKIAAPPGAGIYCHPKGRWPANVILVHVEGCQRRGEGDTVQALVCVEGCQVRKLDEQSGLIKPSVRPASNNPGYDSGPGGYHGAGGSRSIANTYTDSGGASRFFKQVSFESWGPDLTSYLIRMINPKDGDLLLNFPEEGYPEDLGVSLEPVQVVTQVGSTTQSNFDRIICGDSNQMLRELPSASVEYLQTDPPYGLGNREPVREELLSYLRGASLDTGGDFMGKDWEIPSVEFWKECFRILKAGSLVLAFAGTRTLDIMAMGMRAAGFMYIKTLQWVQGQGFPKSQNITKAMKGFPEAEVWEGWGTALKPAWEPILVFSKGPPREPLDSKVAFFYYAKATRGERTLQGRLRSDHPTVKPVRLIQEVIRCTKGSSTSVLDPFLGSGTTAEACIHLGISCLGIEKDPKYAAMSEQRTRIAREEVVARRNQREIFDLAMSLPDDD